MKTHGLPRVLFVSVNPFSSSSNNGKTFASFFEGYPSSHLAQLYFHRESPSNPVCSNYYRITDEEILQNVLVPWRIAGERANVTTAEVQATTLARASLKRSWTARLLRQLVWLMVPIDNNRTVLRWLDEFSPEVVFFCGGDAAALYRKISAVADRYDAGLVYYATDDYVLPIRTRNISAKLLRGWTRRVFRSIAARAALVLVVGEKMAETYLAAYGIRATPIMNMVQVPERQPEPRPRELRDPLKLLYAGSFHSNRWRVLADVVRSIQELRSKGVAVELRIFGPEPAPEERDAMHQPPAATYLGLKPPSELVEEIAGSDVLLHVESDDPESIAVTRLSISTKIPEYLASGRPILAVGPPDVASIAYLRDANAALVTDPHDVGRLRRALEEFATDSELSAGYAQRGWELARASHDGSRIRPWLWRALSLAAR